MIVTTVKFEIPGAKGKKVKHSWQLKHNLEDFGLNMEAAFHNYVARLDDGELPDIKKFCDYVISKDVFNIKCTELIAVKTIPK